MVEYQRVEAVLFASGHYLSTDEIAELTNQSVEDVEESIRIIKVQYNEVDSALTVFQEGEKYKLNVESEYSYLVRRLVSEAELPPAQMETLALIAYKAPVLQSDIVDARSARAYDHIKDIMDRGFVERERDGRTYRLHVTDKFYDYFEVEDQDELGTVFSAIQPPEVDFEAPDEAEEGDEEDRDAEGVAERMMQLDTASMVKEDEDFLDEFDDRLGDVSSRVEDASPDEEDALLLEEEGEEGEEEVTEGE